MKVVLMAWIEQTRRTYQIRRLNHYLTWGWMPDARAIVVRRLRYFNMVKTVKPTWNASPRRGVNEFTLGGLMLALNDIPQNTAKLHCLGVYMRERSTSNDICYADHLVRKWWKPTLHLKFQVGTCTISCLCTTHGFTAWPSTLWQVAFRLLPL